MIKKTVVLASLLLSLKALATKDMEGNKNPVLLKADQFRHEEDLGLVIAEGHVLASDGNQIVEADRLVYNKTLNMVTATGNVYVYDKDGSVAKAHYADLSSDFREVFLQKASLLTPDSTRVSADLVQKDGGKTVYKHAIYSPCNVCQEKDPLWQIKADTVTYDTAVEDVIYKDAFLEMRGIPFFYTPYFSHPGPKVKRRSGFLSPILGNETKLGSIVGAPYYFNLAPDHDMTLTPVMTTNSGPLLGGEYRQQFSKGTFFFRGSITKTDTLQTPSSKKRSERTHGHFLTEGKADISEQWRFDGRVMHASNPDYLKRYGFLEGYHYRRLNYLESNAHTEGFYGRNYAGFHGYYFQNLRDSVDSKTVPTAVPVSSFSYFSPTLDHGSYFHVTGDTLSIQRNRGNKMNRASTTTEWILPYTASHGSVYELKSFVRGDFYDISQYNPSGPYSQVNGDRGRAIPGAALSWRLPFMTELKNSTWVIEPIIKGIAKPNGENSFKIPNEDSQDFEFDARNLFSENRFIGQDVVDDGQHISYGANVNAYQLYGVNMRAFLGQSYDFSKAHQFPASSGVRQGASDYLGRFKIIPSEWGHIDWRFRADNRSGKFRRNVITVTAGPDQFRGQADYVYYDNVYFGQTLGKREQVALKVTSRVTKDWSVFVGARREFKNNPGPLEESLGALYQDECFKFIIEGLRTHYTQASMAPATTIMFTFGFKNLGDLSTGRMGSDNLLL
jgi:LPS-assembly protein